MPTPVAGVDDEPGPVMLFPSFAEEEVHSDIDAASDDRAAHEAAAAAAELAAAHQEALDAAYLRGVGDGREQGEQAERARLRGAMMAAESALDDIRAGETRWLSNIEENIAAISIGVAQQIVVREVSAAPEIVLALVSRAVQEFGLDQALSIRVNPGDLASLRSAERELTDAMTTSASGRDVRWVHDARIEPGGCVVEGRERIVDARVDTGLERLYRRMTYTNA
jgi:flagellar biosynthesis/type III secretory pathway protein FliH